MPVESEQLKCGLVGVTRQILLENMVRHATQGENFCVMVTDAEGRRVLGSSLKMSELAQEGVTHIEDLCKPRQPRSDMGAIYFIGPTQSSIDRLLFDFRDDGEPMYSEAWVFCTGLIPELEFEKLKKAGKCLKRALRCCRDLLVEFTPLPTLGGRAFTLGVPELTRDMYLTSDERDSLETQDRAVERLFQLCISLGEAPEIAYFDLDQSSRSRRANEELLTNTDIAQVAMKLHQKLKDFSYDPKTRQPKPRQKKYMDKMSAEKKKFLPVRDKKFSGPEPALLVLLDRSVDPAGPLVHDMSYEGLCHDLLDTDSHGEIIVEATKTLDSTDPADETWASLREAHFAMAAEAPGGTPGLTSAISARLGQFEKESAFMHASPESAETASAVDRRREKDKVAYLKEYQKKTRQYQSHLKLLTDLDKEIQTRQLLPGPKGEPTPCLCEVESDLITGRDSFEDKVGEKALVDRCRSLLPQLRSEQDKERLLALYWFCIGVHEGGDGNMGELVRAAFPDGPSPRMQQIQEQLVKNRRFCSNLDVSSEKHGTGKKRMVCYGYGVHRRRHTTERDGQERNPQHHGGGLMSTTEVAFQDQVSRYCPSLYWILKDFARGKANPYTKHWKGIDSTGAPKAGYSLERAIDWSDYGRSEDERRHNLTVKGVSTGRLVSKHEGERMIIICVLGGVTYAEIHQAAEIERRTGCTVLIGGSDILTGSDYLDRLSMDPEGEWLNPQQDNFNFDRAAKVAGRSSKTTARGEASGQEQAGCGYKCMTLCGACPLDETTVASDARP